MMSVTVHSCCTCLLTSSFITCDSAFLLPLLQVVNCSGQPRQIYQWRRQLWGTGVRAPSTSNSFIFSSLWSKSDSQLSKYCVVCEISWCRCQRLAALLISTASVTKLLGLVIKPLLHPTLKSAVSAPWPNFQLCPSSQQIFATPLGPTASSQTEPEP